MVNTRPRTTATTWLVGGLVLALALVATGPGAAPAGAADAGPSEAVATSAEPFAAGAARRSITPTSEHLDGCELFLGGFGALGQRGCATGVHEDIHARALALQHGDQRFVVVTLDLPGLGNLQQRAIREGVSWATTIPAPAVLVHVSHTHSGPDFQGLWMGVPESYRTFVVNQAIAAATEALAEVRPAEIRVGEVQESELHANRRGWGFTDDTLAVLHAVDPTDGSTIASLTNYAVHPVVIGMSSRVVATDYVGGVVTRMEEELGGVALYVNGAQGDVSPRAPQGADAYERAEGLGRAIAGRALDAVDVATAVPPGLEVATRQVTFNVENPLFILAATTSLVDISPYYEFREVEEDEGSRFEVDTLFAGITLGDDTRAVRIATLPGEGLTRLALEARELIGCTTQLLFGTTQDSFGYLIPLDEWRTGRNEDYEETVSLEEHAGRKALEAVDELFDACPAEDVDPVEPPPFVDVSGTHAEAIRTLQLLGIVQGVTEDRFEPKLPVRRDQLASLVARLLQLEEVADGPFTDIAGNTHAGAINALAEAGVALGRDGLFDPRASIRRGQAAAFLGRALGLTELAEGPFSDVAGTTHAGWINALAALEIVQGFDGDRFGPQLDIRRDQTASIVARTLPHLPG